MRRGAFPLARALALAVLPLLAPFGAGAATITDAAGRRVELPDRIERVLPAGHPAAVVVYMLAPEKLIGWTRALSPAERAYIPARYADLPELGRLTGRGSTVNLEAVLRARPDLILDIGSTGPTYASLADRVEAQTGIPYALIGGGLADTAATFRTVGAILGVEERAERLARYAEKTLAEVAERTSRVPHDRRLKVFVARGPRGLETGIAGSINVEVLDFVAVRNVAAEGMGAGGIVNVSLEQVLEWQPDAIVTLDRNFFATVWNHPAWAEVKAVRDKRVYLSPGLPFTWIDSPPSANRLIGVRWLAKVLYPELFPEDLREETRRFYALFYHQEPTEAQLDQLLGSRAPG